MRLKKRYAVIAAAFLCVSLMGAMGLARPLTSSKSELASRVESLEKQNAELRKQVEDLSTKLDLLTQRVNNSCPTQVQGTFSTNESAAVRPAPPVPGLEVVKLAPEKPAAPARPKGRLIVKSSDEQSDSMIEQGAPLPGTNYVPLPDPETAIVEQGPAESTDKHEAASAMASPGPESSPKPAAAPGEAAAFKKIKELAEQGSMEEAAPLMDDYLKTYAKGAHVDEVAYMAGDYYYNNGEYKKAIENYKTVTQDYATSDKAPDALLKTGKAFLELGRTEEAEQAFQDVKTLYPFSDAADQAEKELSSCCK